MDAITHITDQRYTSHVHSALLLDAITHVTDQCYTSHVHNALLLIHAWLTVQYQLLDLNYMQLYVVFELYAVYVVFELYAVAFVLHAESLFIVLTFISYYK